ncbi:uncharacterized protein CPUR_08508 [Claviceps purpurea 20.1]|uniref:Uncharacterized protein n=1 Tax=Claviceps purpurea (strain 20.1) TaxID=1111077 RepID=M1WD56_CLAP2|nr:uncharacterized protein CPUR_08508 [Claviceps purpurea 20.1]
MAFTDAKLDTCPPCTQVATSPTANATVRKVSVEMIAFSLCAALPPEAETGQ